LTINIAIRYLISPLTGETEMNIVVVSALTGLAITAGVIYSNVQSTALQMSRAEAGPSPVPAPVHPRTIAAATPWSEQQCNDRYSHNTSLFEIAAYARLPTPGEDELESHPTWRTPERLREVISNANKDRENIANYIQDQSALIAHDCVHWTEAEQEGMDYDQDKVSELDKKIEQLTQELRSKTPVPVQNIEYRAEVKPNAVDCASLHSQVFNSPAEAAKARATCKKGRK
jgi:hypothetical protein